MIDTTRVGPYRILERLGSGGMGVVFRAHDPRLDREVAIKVLREVSVSSALRVKQFELEARAAGRLNHPNVVVVHDVGTHAGRSYIVYELLEGESLRSAIQRGPLPAARAGALIRQVAEGLGAAHAKGIVHRDLKPENLFVTSDGRIKILDFGVAKLTEPVHESSDTDPGDTEGEASVLIGTARYMSPEQVRGEPLDARSDVFSLGAVFYEMLTGHAAFHRDTTAETMTAILRDHPPPLVVDAAPGMVSVVFRCLERSPDARFQSARDVAFSLEALDAGPPAASRPVAVPRHRRAGGALAGAVVLLAAAVGVAWLARGDVSIPPPSDDALGRAQFRRLTGWEGVEGDAAVSPDGRFVAFLSDRAGEFDVWLNQVGTEQFVNLTTAIDALGPPAASLRRVGFSGDGAHIWFTQGTRQVSMPVSGGAVRPFLGDGAAAPAWSPDGGRIVFFTNGPGDPLSIADGAGGEAAVLPIDFDRSVRDGSHNHNPVWSPDGEWIYFTHGPGVGPALDLGIWRVREAGGAPQHLAPHVSGVTFIVPVDGRTLLYIAPDADGSGPWLWTLDVPTNVTRRAVTGLERYTSVSASADGRLVVVTLAATKAGLWRVPLQASPALEGQVEEYGRARVDASAPRLRGRSLFHLSATGAGTSLWHELDGQALEIWSAADGVVTHPPAVSPDGSRVAVAFTRQGRQHIALIGADGTGRQTLGPSVQTHGTMDWSPDGQWLVSGGRTREGEGLFLIPVNGAAPRRIVDGAAANPVWSPDGRLIVYTGTNVGGDAPLLAVDSSGSAVDFPPVRTRGPGGQRFLPDSQGMVYTTGLDFWLLDLKTKASRPLTRFSDEAFRNRRAFDVTPDGRHIVFDRWRNLSDVVLVERR